MTPPNERPSFLNVRGQLPAWTWRDLHAATRDARSRPCLWSTMERGLWS